MRIFADWGSTNFRAYLADETGMAVDRRVSLDMGAMKALAGANRIERFSGFLAKECEAWLAAYPAAPILLCGAIGNREGWVETQYTTAPAGLETLAGNLRRLTSLECGLLAGRTIAVSPGISQRLPDGRCDMMRSEEVKSLGAVMGRPGRHLLCIPGTHCKWVEIADGRIVDFATVISGELYAQLIQAGSFAPLLAATAHADDEARDNSFQRGVQLGASGGDLMSDLWQLRAQTMVGAAPPAAAAYLSGILLAHEMQAMRHRFGDGNTIILLCDTGERQRFYRNALQRWGWTEIEAMDSEAAVCAGLHRIARHAGL